MARDPEASAFDRGAVLQRLEDSLRTVEWATSLVPAAWSHRSPYPEMSREEGAWSVAMNLAHLTLYTERLPTTVLESLAAGGDGVSDSWFREPTAYEDAAVELASASLEANLARLRAATAREAELASGFSDEQWTAPLTRAWGTRGLGPRQWSPARVVAKSVQHTWEHGNAILIMALFSRKELIEE